MKIIHCILLISIFSSCQVAKEFHYFKEGDNYYRISVKERAFLSSSRYQSGFYDEYAVDNYFGEIHRPDSTGRVIPIQSGNNNSDSSGKSNVAPANTKLVLILSTNSDVIAEQIGNLAENEQTLEIIARLSNKGISTENSQLKQTIANSAKKDSSLINFGNSTISAIQEVDKTKGNLTKINSAIMAFINSLAASTGRKIPFSKFEEAEKWFYENY